MALSFIPNAPVFNGGQVLTSNGVTTSYVSPPLNFHDGSNKVMSIPNGSKTVVLEETATLDIKGSVKINGIDLEERLSIIETVLCIPQRDVTMEVKYPKLKALYEEYMHELEKYKTWERIKNDNSTE